MVLGWIDVVNNVQPCRCSANGMRRSRAIWVQALELLQKKRPKQTDSSRCPDCGMYPQDVLPLFNGTDHLTCFDTCKYYGTDMSRRYEN